MSDLTAQERKQRPMFRGLFRYFPDALEAVSYVSYVGNQQHNPGQDLHWDKSKSTDNADALLRHLKEYAEGKKIDSDGLSILSKVAWRALAVLEIEIEREKLENTHEGVKIGKRTLLKFLGFQWIGKSYKAGRWLVQCECGRQFECGDENYKSSWVGSCNSCAQQKPCPTRRKRPFEYRYNATAHRTKHAFLISYDEFFEFTKTQECHYCGDKINWGPAFGKHRSSGLNLDRKDSNKPYVVDNLVVACRRCNYGKNNFFSYEEWVKIGNLIRQWRQTEGAPIARGAKND